MTDFNFEEIQKNAEQEAIADETKSLPRVTKEDILFVLEQCTRKLHTTRLH